MPRKEYKKQIIPFMKAYPLQDADKTFESMKKEAARFVGVLDRWMKYQIEFGDEDEVEYFEEFLFKGVLKSKTYLSKIYTANKKLNKLEFEVDNAKVARDQSKVNELMDQKSDIEEDVAGYFWRIYKIYCFIRPKIQIDTTGGKQKEEYSEAETAPEAGS